jgi:hypothetical protein
MEKSEPTKSRSEQQLMVAKPDELMRCVALKARLTAAETTTAHLLDAAL